MLKQKQLRLTITRCPDGLCPVGIDELKEVALTLGEKRSIYFKLKDEIFKQKQLMREMSLL